MAKGAAAAAPGAPRRTTASKRKGGKRWLSTREGRVQDGEGGGKVRGVEHNATSRCLNQRRGRNSRAWSRMPTGLQSYIPNFPCLRSLCGPSHASPNAPAAYTSKVWFKHASIVLRLTSRCCVPKPLPSVSAARLPRLAISSSQTWISGRPPPGLRTLQTPHTLAPSKGIAHCPSPQLRSRAAVLAIPSFHAEGRS